MNTMRMGIFCALVGWMAADARAQSGIYGSPDPIPLGRPAPQYSYMSSTANRTPYVAAADSSGPTLIPAPYSNIPQPPSESSAVSSMLGQPSPMGGPASGCNMLPPGGCIKDAGKCGCDTCGDIGCGCRCGGCCSRWYASADSLYMTRSQPNRVYTSASGSNLGYFNDENWTWGGQATVGYRIGCDWALEGTCWGLLESNTDGGPAFPGPYVSPLNFGLVNILNLNGGTATANQWTDGSPYHHIWRNDETLNLELNAVRTICGGECNGFGFDFLAGVRWFRFQDGFVFGALQAGSTDNWLFLNDHITNDLVGLQAGFDVSYRFANCLKVFATPKVGVFDNHMTLDYNVYAVNAGTQYQGSSLTAANPNYPVHATTDGFAFLTQVDLGLDWQITRHVSTQLGYRVVAMTGMGLSDSQIPSSADETQSIANIQHSDSLLLHGAFGGLTFSW